jgi:hypothetical protein
MPNFDKQALIAKLDALHVALQGEPGSPAVVQALHQCDRLRQAILQFHAEGLRFAAFTLTRLMQQPGANWQDPTKTAARDLKEGLDAAGYGA